MRTVMSMAFLLMLTGCLMSAGCVSHKMFNTRTLADGTVIEYRIKIDSVGQDLTGSDLSASLNPEGRTTFKAGAIDNSTSQVTADVAASMVELIKAMLPYIATAPAAP